MVTTRTFFFFFKQQRARRFLYCVVGLRAPRSRPNPDGIRRFPAYDDLFIYLFRQGGELYLVKITLQQVTVNSSSVLFFIVLFFIVNIM